MKTFHESLRYEIDGLTPDSAVMDVGAHKGDFAAEIFRRYRCTVHCYEPVPEFFNLCVRRFADSPKIRVWPYALGVGTSVEKFGVKGDMSGEFCTSPNETVEVRVHDFVNEYRGFFGAEIDLLKLNIEGGEYDILESAWASGIIPFFNRISVQFHTVVPSYVGRHAAIRSMLSETHDIEYDEPYCWTGWVRR